MIASSLLKNTLGHRAGFVLTISAPSGTGKTTVANHLLQYDPSLRRSISMNTRAKRPSEIEGVDYVFVSPETFEMHELAGNLIETAEVYGSKRGTPKAPLLFNIEKGVDTVCVIDWNGVDCLKRELGNQVVSILLYPPSLQTLRNRLVARNQDKPEEIERRLGLAQAELNRWGSYDYSIINDDLERCVETVSIILTAERNKTCRFIKEIDL